MSPEIDQVELDTLRASAAAGETAAAALERSQEVIEGLQGAGQRATDSTAALLQVTKDANPQIPADLISGEDAKAIAASVEGAKVIGERFAKLNAGSAPAGGEKPPGGAGAPPRDAGSKVPEGLRGISRISFALSNPGPGNTEE